MPSESNLRPPIGLFRLSLVAIFVGIVTGFGAIAFRALIGFIHNLFFLGRFSFFYDANIYTPPSPWGAFVILVPVVGALVVTMLVTKFVNEAARGGKMEVKLGQLAEQNASSARVKQFGERMVKDHTRLNSELASMAKKIGLTVPSTLSSEQQTEYAKLAKLSGASFDTAYMNLMVKDHTSDLAAFRKEETTTQNRELKATVSKAMPVIEEHLEIAKSDSSKLAVR
jgi:putative membrane protein